MGLDEGRQAFERRAWQEAYELLAAEDGRAPLCSADLERLAQAAYLVGREVEARALFTRVHQVLVDEDRPERAARWGFWLSFHALLRGDTAQSTGWFARIQRLMKDSPDCAEQGFVLMLSALMQIARRDLAGAQEQLERIVQIGERTGDADLSAFGLLGLGQALIQDGITADGAARLDEAMISVASGRVSPMATGVIYCAVILTCQRIFDLRRCREWTRALGEWCTEQPGLVQYGGQCMVHRSEILQLDGEWDDALAEASQALELYAGRDGGSAGRAAYQCAELHRLRGQLDRAEELYQRAGLLGSEPQPGLSLLRLAQGRLEAAAAAIRRVVSEARQSNALAAAPARPGVLAAYVEIMLAAGDLDSARAGADELEQLAATTNATVLQAMWHEAAGAVLLAEGAPELALGRLRAAWAVWQELQAPYQAARTRVLIGRACRALRDGDTARSHFDAARGVLNRLGAAPAIAGLEVTAPAAPPAESHALTRRELEVLRLVAAGRSNRHIAAALFISEHTVARHMANIFNKLDVTSRTGAVAFALEHHLV